MTIKIIMILIYFTYFFFSSRRRHTRSKRDWSSDVCSSDLFLSRCRTGTVYPHKDARRGLYGRSDKGAYQGRVCCQNKNAAGRSEERRVGKEWRWRWWREE